MKRRLRKHRARSAKREKQGIGDLAASGVVGLTKAQMAAALQISVRTLNRMMERKEITYFRITPRLVRFLIEDALKRMRETVLVEGVER